MSTQETWADLVAEAERNGTAAGIVRLRVHPDSRPSIFLAVERPSDTPLLLLRLRRSSIPPGHRLPVADGFTVAPVVQPDDDAEHATLVIRLSDTRYADIFSALVDDVVSAILPTPNDDRLVSTLAGRLTAWQRFLAAHGLQGLGKEAQQGLFGELQCLRAYMLPNIEAMSAISAWTGPAEAVHDFQLPSCAVEVKTTATKQLQSIRVSNERQLDDTYVPRLWLCHYSLDISPAVGESLVEMIASVRTSLEQDGIARQAFDDRLWSAGYMDAQADVYQDTRYQIRDHNVFSVGEGFPRITEQGLMAGVGDVQYSISVAECKHFAVDVTAFVRSLTEDTTNGI